MNEDRWIEMYSQLEFYSMAHNRSTNVPQGSTKFKKLANWVKFQRQQYSKDKLSEERLGIVQSLGFQWRNRNRWLEMYNFHVAYKTKYRATFVLQDWKEDRKFGMWVSNQRCLCKDPDRIKLLNDIDFIWKVQKS